MYDATWGTLIPRGGQRRNPRELMRLRRNCPLARPQSPIFEHATFAQVGTPLGIGLGLTRGIGEVEVEESIDEGRRRSGTSRGEATFIYPVYSGTTIPFFVSVYQSRNKKPRPMGKFYI